MKKQYKQSEVEKLDLDFIWEKREFIQNLHRVAEEEYGKMVNQVQKDGLSDELEEWLFDFTFNEKEATFFNEWLFERGVLQIDEN